MPSCGQMRILAWESEMLVDARLRPSILLYLAVRDLLHGWRSTLCLIAATSVALAPLLLLYGLNVGVVENLINKLMLDPRIREIRLLDNKTLSLEWFEDLRSDQRVAFLLPRTRYLASAVSLRANDGGPMVDPRLIPSATGDPLLGDLPVPSSTDEIALTQRIAIESGLSVGDGGELLISRQVDQKRTMIRHPVIVVSILPRDYLQTNDIFVTVGLEDAIERWREGFDVPELGWPGIRGEKRQTEKKNSDKRRSFASFRLYARDIRDVPGLRDRLLRDGLDVGTRAESIETTLAIESGLGWVFAVITSLAAAGFLLTLGLHLAASVVEKSRELALLRLLGLRSLEMSVFPSIQGILIATTGAFAAGASTLFAQPIINTQLEGLAGLEGRISNLALTDVLVAVCVSAFAGAIAGCVAGYRAASLEPTDGLRSE